LIDAQGVLKLADFGLARQYGDPMKKMTPTVVTRYILKLLIIGGIERQSCF
jgi:serine/threonine protein kinase